MRMRPSAMVAILPWDWLWISLASDGGAPAPRRPAARTAGFRSPRTAGPQPRDVLQLALLLGDREEAGDDRASPRFACDLYRTLVLFDDVDLGEALLALPQVHLGEERVHWQACDERETPPARHGLDGIAHEVVEDLHHAVLVGQDGGQAGVVAPDDLDAERGRFLLEQEGHALEELMDIERHGAERDRAPEVQQHLDDAVDPGHLLEEHRRVLTPARLVAERALD